MKKYKCIAAQAYLVIGYLASLPEDGYEIDDDEVTRALDYFSLVAQGGAIDDDFLPFIGHKKIEPERPTIEFNVPEDHQQWLQKLRTRNSGSLFNITYK